VLCQPGQVHIRVFNTVADCVATYDTAGGAGTNVFTAKVADYSHGVYYYFVSTDGGRSKPAKFSIIRSP
jgi:hypothetical protein